MSPIMVILDKILGAAVVLVLFTVLRISATPFSYTVTNSSKSEPIGPSKIDLQLGQGMVDKS
jgi:hypothetical protein